MFEVHKTPGSGYKLIDKGAGIYQLRTPSGAYTGNLRQVCTYSVINLGFSIQELELGVIEMEKNFHNAAEYGIMKTFMYTTDMDDNTVKH